MTLAPSCAQGKDFVALGDGSKLLAGDPTGAPCALKVLKSTCKKALASAGSD